MSTPLPLRSRLLDLARASISHGLEHHRPVEVDLDQWPEAARREHATFVTLHLRSRLRGCIGALEATRPLVRDVAANAFAAAFRDPRFCPVAASDLTDLEIHLSVLSPIEAMVAGSEEELLRQLRPGVDGLILEEARRRGTFLPAVWRTLPEPREFLAGLKAKAGLAADYWSGSIRIYRYTAEEF